MRKGAKKALKFTEQTLKSVAAGKRPFLEKWFGQKIDTIFEASPPVSKDRDPYMWRNKMVYALFMVINPKFNKKRFSELFEIAYGTARNWVNDKKGNSLAL